MSVLVTGASGLVGTALGRAREITPLPRRPPPGGGPWWSPSEGRVEVPEDMAIDSVVHLAGAGVADKRWTEDRKAMILDSRVQGTQALVRWMAARTERPKVLVSASAVGFYGNGGDDVKREDAPVGAGFLAQVCEAWEAEAINAEALGVRVVRLRIGIVLEPSSGALAKMLPAFKMGAGGPVGDGQQWFPWIHVRDLVRVIEWALDSEDAQGVYNCASPGIVRQGQFAKALGKTLRRPAILPAPAFALRAAFGSGLANEALLAGQRVKPQRLADAGFTFEFPELGPALEELLG